MAITGIKMNISKTVAALRPSGCRECSPQGDDGDKREGDDPVLPAGDAGKIIGQIIGEEYGIENREKERGGPVPPSREKSPEISECGAAPAIEAAFDRHGSGEFGGHERDRDRQEKWDDQKKIRLMPGPLVVTMPSSPKGPPVV